MFKDFDLASFNPEFSNELLPNHSFKPNKC